MGIGSWKEKVKRLKTDVYALYLAFKDRRTPWYTKAFIILIVAYALSPVDLIPDFIPVIGYLDDLILVPAGIYLAIKMVPGEVLAECRRRAISEKLDTRSKWIAAAVIIFIWLLVLYLVFKAIWLD
jgi:uncharacterized membrane protein YkvA (DUF1232 family)